MTFRLPNLRLILLAVAVLALLAVFALAPASVSPNSVAHAQSADAEPTIINTCDRTPQVRDAILAELYANDCADVTDSDLNRVTSLALYDEEITALQAGDFQGLTNLQYLHLQYNSLTELPAGLFDGLSSLEQLSLSGNALTELPDGVFDDLSSLKRLYLFENALTELPDGVFDDLSSLERLHLYENALTALPDGVFNGLSNLNNLELWNNALTELPDGVFNGLSNLEYVTLGDNNLTELPDGVFNDLSSLRELYLSSNDLSELPDGVFDGLSNLERLNLYDNALTELPDGVFNDLSSLLSLSLNSNEVSALPDGTFDGLSNLYSLDLSNNPLTELPDGVFDDFSGLEHLHLSDNGLTALPDGVFNSLSSLEWLYIGDNALTELPDGVFNGLSSLEWLYIGDNALTELPDGLFVGLSELDFLNLEGNPGSPFTFTAELEQRGDDAFVVKVAEGAPLDTVVTLSAQGGILSATTMTIPGGNVTSEEITITRPGTVSVEWAAFTNYQRYKGFQTGLGEPLVLGAAEAGNTFATGAPAVSGSERVGETLTVSTSGIADADGLSGATFSYQWVSNDGTTDSDIQGATDATYTLVPADEGKTINVRVSFTDDAGNEETLTSIATAAVTPQGICDRTPEVRDAILGWLETDAILRPDSPDKYRSWDCATVTDHDLSSITGTLLWSEFNTISTIVVHNTLKAGDFSRLGNLESLKLKGDLSGLPVGVFDGLDNLEWLKLESNELRELPDGVFDGLDNLERLVLNHNNLGALTVGVFDGLANLRELSLNGNNLGALTVGVFDGLDNLERLGLGGNSLTELTVGVFDGLANLRELSLNGNNLGALTVGVFDGLDNLERLGLGGNSLTELPVDVFDGLANLRELSLNGNNLTTLSVGVFDGLANLERLSLTDNNLGALPVGVFDGLDNLEWLGLKRNSLTELPVGVFDGLDNLKWLSLSVNDLTTLSVGVFDGLDNLESLRLGHSDLSGLPDGVFDGLDNLKKLILSDNNLGALPDGVFADLANLSSLHLDNNELRELPDGVFDGLANLEGLELRFNDLRELPDGVFDDLTALEYLNLRENKLSGLPDGAFDSLTNLTSLNLSGNWLKAVSSDAFDGLDSLRYLDISSNHLETLPEGVFEGLALLRYLDISSNHLETLPDGVFEGLVSLIVVDLRANNVARCSDGPLGPCPPFTLTAELEQHGEDSVVVRVAEGTPFIMRVWLWAEGGTLSNRFVTISAGSTVSRPIVVTPSEEGETQVTIRVEAADFQLRGHFDWREPPLSLDEEGPQGLRGVEAGVGEPLILLFGTPKPETPSTDATLNGLALSGLDFGTFDSATTWYTASVVNDVDETTVTPTTNDAGATYEIKLGEVTDDDGTIPLAVGSNVITIEVTAEDGNTVKTYTVTVTRAAPPAPGPAVAVELSPSGSVDEGTEIALTMSFANLESDSDTSDTDYIFRADVVNADACEGGGMGGDRYMYKVDEDPEVRAGTISASCAPGDYTVEVSISSPGNVELASATAVFTVNAPAEQQQAAEPLSTDATFSDLALSNVDFGAFASSTTEYTASVANDVDETTVTLTTNDDGATYVFKLDGVADDDGVIPLSVGSNVITVEVTAEDGNTVKTYTVTVTRAAPPAPGPAVAVELSPSGSVDEGTEIALTMSFANLESDSDTSDTDYIFRADVVNADACEGGGMGEDRYMYKVDEDPEVRTGAISTSCAPGDYTVEVSISSPGNVELASATADFTVAAPAEQQQAQEPPPSTDATLSGLALSDVTLAFASSTTEYTATVANDVDETTVTPTTNDDGATYVVKLDGVADDDSVVPLSVGSNTITIEVTAEDGNATQTYTVTVTRAAPLSTDATLSGLILSGIDLGAFDSATTGYTASVANDVDETTVTPTTNDDGASYVVKLGGVTDEDGVVPLAVGSNVITIEVTAEDGNTAKTYKVTITRAEPDSEVSTDATLSGLTLSGIDFGAFDSATTGYTASVANDVSQTNVTPTTNDDGATYVVKLSGVTDDDRVIPLAVGANVITVEVTAEDGNTIKTYTVTVTRAAPPSSDATLKSLTLSGVNFGNFDPATTGYTASVVNDVTQTTVTPTTNDDGATYVVKLSGVTDDDRVIPLSVGTNVITVEVTAEDGNTIKTYTVTVTRAAPPSSDATLKSLTLSGVNFGAFDSATTGYTASVANDVDETTVTPTTNDDGATYAIKLGGVADDDGVIPLAVGKNVIAVEVTAEDGQTTKTYTITVTRAEAEPTPDSPPKTPDAPTGKVTGTGQVQLDWKDVAGAAYYQARFWDDGAAEWVELPTDEIGIVIDGSGATVSNLPDYGIYFFSVRAGNAAGLSDWSEYLSLPNPEQ